VRCALLKIIVKRTHAKSIFSGFFSGLTQGFRSMIVNM